MSERILEIRHLSKSFGSHAVLKDIDFTVDQGDVTTIIGASGSGKSTLVRVLGGLLTPSEGQCLVKGTDIQEIDFRELRSTVGMVFQDPENQIVAAMVEDDAAFAPENQGLASSEIQARVDSALFRVNMTHKQDASVAELSGGEKQRLALAGVLAAKVECLILDEATAMLDSKGRLDIEQALRKLHANGMTIIQVTHQIGAENFDDIHRVIVLSHGSIQWQGTTQDFWDKAEELGFELPDAFKFKRYCESRRINPYGKMTPPGLAMSGTESFHHDKRVYREVKENSVKFKIDGVSFRYTDKSYALKNIDAEFLSGEWLSIIGRTGSGKSTLVQHLNALYKIQEGQILFDGHALPQKGEEVHSLRQKVGLVFQHPEDQLFSPTVREELAFAPKNAGFRKQELDDAIIYGLECAGLPRDFLERNPIALSGGERRLVAIASVLSARPECIVLDEPLAGLDASYQRKILSMLGRLRDEGKTVITVTHDLDMALNYSDRILILRNAEKIHEGRPHEMLEIVMNSLEPEAWPEVLRISTELRKVNQDFPLLYNYQELIACISRT